MSFEMDLIEFELIIILKTEIFRVNLNFLDKLDLQQIEEIAYDLGIESYLTYYDLKPLYNADYEKEQEIYKQWCDDITKAYNLQKNKILKR